MQIDCWANTVYYTSMQIRNRQSIIADTDKCLIPSIYLYIHVHLAESSSHHKGKADY